MLKENKIKEKILKKEIEEITVNRCRLNELLAVLCFYENVHILDDTFF